MTKPNNSTDKPVSQGDSAIEAHKTPSPDIQTEKTPVATSATGPTIDLEAANPPSIDVLNGSGGGTKSPNLRALKHGAYYKGLLPWESHEDFDVLFDDIGREWNPQGALEDETALTLCQWIWKKRRVHVGGQITYYRSSIAKELKSGATSLEELIARQSKVPNQVNNLITKSLALSEALFACSDTISNHYYWTNTTEGKDIQMELAKMQSQVATLASNVRDQAFAGYPELASNVKKLANLFEQAYQPDEIEKETKLLAMIDREIDKAMKRMMFLKTFKESARRETGPRLIANSPPVAPGECANQIEGPNENIEGSTKTST